MGGFKVILPEPLLILKTKAEKERFHSLAGFKDRIDILSLLYKIDIDKNFVLALVKKYNLMDFKERIEKIIKESKEEYAYFFPDSKNPRVLKKLKIELLKKI